MKKSLILAIVLLLATPIQAMAINRTGNDLLVDCNNLIKTESAESISKEKILGMGYCIGLIDGLITFNYVYEAVLQGEGKSSLVQMCLPERISTRQSAQVIVKYLQKNPQQLHQPGQALAAQAFVAAFPCDQVPAE